MNNYKIESNSAKETIKIANKIAQNVNVGDIIILTGDLGAGKTKFVEGFLGNFSLQNEISSPTFNIVNEYKTSNINIYHFDVYRLESIDEFYEIGGEEYFEKGICLIEWGEILKEVLPSNYLQIIISKDEFDENKRYFEFIAYGKAINLLEKIRNI